MFNNRKPFGKEKLSRTELDGIIDKTEAKLGIEGTGAGVRGGVYSTVASLAVMFALIIGGAYLMHGVLQGGNSDIASEPDTTVTPVNESADSVYTGESSVPEDVKGIPVDELPESLKYYYSQMYDKTAVSYIAKNYSKLAFEPVSSENDHFCITLESLLCDDVTVNITAKIEALDDVGSAYLSDGHILPVTMAYDKAGNYITWTEGEYDSNGGVPETDTCKYFKFSFDKYYLNGEQEIQLKMYDADTLRLSGNKPGEPAKDLTDIFTGINFSVNTASNLETLTLVSDSGAKVYISPLQFYRRIAKTNMVITVTDVDNDRDGTYTKPDAMSFTINYADGSSKEFKCKNFGDHYYDLSNISSIYYNGGTYFPQ